MENTILNVLILYTDKELSSGLCYCGMTNLKMSSIFLNNFVYLMSL